MGTIAGSTTVWLGHLDWGAKASDCFQAARRMGATAIIPVFVKPSLGTRISFSGAY